MHHILNEHSLEIACFRAYCVCLCGRTSFYFRRRRRCFCKVSEWTHVLATIRQNYFRSRRSTSSRWPSSPCLFRFLIASFSRSWTASIANRLRCSALVSGRAVRVLIGQLCRGVIFVNEERKLERCCNSIKEGRGLHVCAVRNC